MKTFNYVLVMMFLVILSCQKEDLTPLPEESLSENQTVSFRSTPIADRDASLVNAFYVDLLALQERTGFYDNFYEQYGYFNWSGSLEYQSGGAGKILVVPVKTSALGMANGAFLYFDNGTDKRIKFVSRDAVEGKIAANRLGDLSSDEIFAYRNFLLTDLKHPESQQAMPAMNLSVFFDGFEEESFGGNDCEGGSYQYICFYNTSGSDELNPARLLRQFMDESYGTGDHISTTYNGATLSELEEHYNQIMNSLPPDQRAEFDRYLNDRRQLYLATGIDDEISGILTGIVIDLDRVCFNVWVWCWEDPFDFDFGSGGGGSGGGGGGNEDFHPTWQEEYDQLRFCEGVNDIFDTGPDNPSQLHPNYDFCAIWMAYLEDCIMPNQPEFNDFEAIGTYEELVLTWAEFQYNNPELFTAIIADPADCTPTSELDDYTPEEEGEGEGVIVDAECRNALDDFLVAHGIILTKAERFAILTSGGNPECTDQEAFEEWVIIYLAQNMEDCDTYDFIWCDSLEEDPENAPNGICPDSFLFVTTGDTFTCDMSHVVFTYRGADNRTMYIGDLCITVPKRDYEGNAISSSDASELMTNAWNAAQYLTAQEFRIVEHAMTSIAYKNLFLENLRLQMLLNFEGTFGTGTMIVTNSNCSGNYPTAKPRYSILCY